MLEERTHIPVVGVAPYMELEVEDEDSLTERFSGKQEVDLIDIAVIRVPRISNFTDFNALEVIPGVSLRYVRHVQELKNPDMIILPGTKNTMEDLLWMRQNGLEAAVLKKPQKERSSSAYAEVIRCWERLWQIRNMWKPEGDQRHGSSAYGYGI